MHRRYATTRYPQQCTPGDPGDLLEDFRDFAATPGLKQRLALKAEAEGCTHCGQRTPPHFAGYSDGEFSVICAECGDVDPPVSVVRDGRRGPVPLITRWDSEDHKWFGEHPRRQFRLRAPFTNEPCLDVPGAAARIADARRSGHEIAVMVWWTGTEFVRQPGMFSGEPETMAALTDRGIERWAAGR